MSRPLEIAITPAIRLAARLSLAWKIALVCAVLLVPTLLLGSGYRSGMNAQTSFAANEQAGIVYAKPLIGLARVDGRAPQRERACSARRARRRRVSGPLGDRRRRPVARQARREEQRRDGHRLAVERRQGCRHRLRSAHGDPERGDRDRRGRQRADHDERCGRAGPQQLVPDPRPGSRLVLGDGRLAAAHAGRARPRNSLVGRARDGVAARRTRRSSRRGRSSAVEGPPRRRPHRPQRGRRCRRSPRRATSTPPRS